MRQIMILKRLLNYLINAFRQCQVLNEFASKGDCRHNFNNYAFLSQLNDIFTSRPSIWNYYLANYDMNLFGNQLADVVLTGVNWTVGRGAFDGDFIFIPNH